MKSHLPENLKYLRKKHQMSQQQLADHINISRTTLGDYERGNTEPSIEALIGLSSLYDISVDQMLMTKLQHSDLEIARDNNLRVLAISVDQDNRQNIEMVPAKAQAGYLESFQDPDYIRELPKLYFPSIPEGTYRAFEIQGDSMSPLPSGSVVICSYIERLEELKNERTYIIATHLDGIVYKRVLINPDRTSITAMSDNPLYPPFKIPFRDIAEIWQYYAHISFNDTKQQQESELEEKITDIQKTVHYIRQRMAE